MNTQNATVSVRNGIIYVQGYIDGVRHRKSTGKKDTKANLTWARKNAYDVLLKLTDKQQMHVREYNFQDFAYKSLELNSMDRKENTNADYLNIFKCHILPYFKNWELQDIRALDLKQWQMSLLKKGLSGKRVKNIRSVFQFILKDAYQDELIDKNPFDLVKPPKVIKKEVVPFSLHEIEILIQNAEGWFKHYLTIAFFTGLRTGEMIGLKWCDIDFEKDIIKVQRAISKGVIGSPKTESSKREVFISRPVKEALKEQFLLTGLRNDFVFLTQHHRHFKTAYNITVFQWKPLLEESKLEYRVLYQTRHTFASLMLQQKEDIAWISKMMGHTNIHTTLIKYARYIPIENEKRASFLDDLKLKIS